MTRALLAYIALVVAAQFLWNAYQDFPSVTGFYDHTVVCK